MADEIIKRDQNYVTVLAGVTDDSDLDIQMLRVDPITKRLLVKSTGGSSISLLTNGIPNASQTILNLINGTNTTITDNGGGDIQINARASGIDTQIQFNNSGSFDASSDLTYDYSNRKFSVGDLISSGSSTTFVVDDATRSITLQARSGFRFISPIVGYYGTLGVNTLSNDHFYELPDADGTMVLSVNGTAPDSAGNVTVSAGIGGSGTTNEIAYFTGASTIGSLSTGTYPSLTELSYVKGVTSAIQTQLNAKGVGDMVLASAQTVTGAKTFNDTKLLLRNVADTFNGSFVNTNTANRVYTLPNVTTTLVGKTGTMAANYVPYWNDANQITGGTNLTYDGTTLIMGNVATFTGELVSINRNANSVTGIVARNTTSGTAGRAMMAAVAGSNGTYINSLSAGYTTSGMLQAGKTVILSDMPSGINIGTNNNTTFDLYTNNASRLSISGTGQISSSTSYSGALVFFTNSNTGSTIATMNLTGANNGYTSQNGILILNSSTATSSTVQTYISIDKTNINATTSQEHNIEYALRDNSSSRAAATIAMKYSDVGSGTQTTDFTFRTLQGGTTLSDSIRIRGRHLEMLTGTATGVTVAINAGTATLSTGASDHVGKVTANNTGVSTITITFGQAFTHAPSAFAYNETTPANICSVITTTTTLVITCTTVTGDKIAYGVLAS